MTLSSEPQQTNPSMAYWHAERERLATEWSEPITLDALTGPNGKTNGTLFDDGGNPATWLIAQRKQGHRHSADDVLTAWYALRTSPKVDHLLDLGTGIGTVGLLTLWGMENTTRLTCVEAQELSFRLLQINLAANGLSHRVHSIHADLRELSLGRKFPLITGSPPYFPQNAGIVPEDSQKAHARFELRGGVADYAITAANHLDPNGWLILCFPTARKQHAIDGIVSAKLDCVRLMDVIPRANREPLFTLFACRHPQASGHQPLIEPPLTVRDETGRLTAEMAAVRRLFGFADGEAHGGHQP